MIENVTLIDKKDLFYIHSRNRMIINSKTEKIARLVPSLASDLLVALSGTLVLGLAAQLELRLPFTPVPVTAQTFVVMLIGAFLGPNRGVLAIFLYLSSGVFGLPVFSGFGSGLHHILGPTGGYIIGFIGGAYVTGTFINPGVKRSFLYSFLIMLLSCSTIYVIGVLWLGFYLGFNNVLELGVLPFISGDIVKSAAAAVFFTGIQKFGKYQS